MDVYNILLPIVDKEETFENLKNIFNCFKNRDFNIKIIADI